MNRIHRLTAILIQLQTKRVLTAREIAARFGISLRTVYRDIRALEDAGVPIGAEAGMGYFLTKGYHLPPVMFTRQEAGALIMAGKLMEKFTDVPINLRYTAALDKIKAVLESEEQDFLDNLSGQIQVLTVAPAEPEGFPNRFLLDLQAVLGQKQVIAIEYYSAYRDQETLRWVEPLGLCFYAGHWHLLAFCRLRQDYRDFRVDRIKQMTPTNATFDARRHDPLTDLVQRMVIDSDLKPAVVRFDGQTARRIQNQKYYFGFVDERQLDQEVEMKFLVSSYDYLSHWLISFVDRVRIVAPKALCRQVTRLAQRIADHYL
jgi:predicted DNA-binding transcriptional regulator YafY